MPIKTQGRHVRSGHTEQAGLYGKSQNGRAWACYWRQGRHRGTNLGIHSPCDLDVGYADEPLFRGTNSSMSASALERLVLNMPPEQIVEAEKLVAEWQPSFDYGRTVAVCRANGEDLSAILVREGLAWAFVRYSGDYAEQEALAKTYRRGIHAHDCEPAWQWRASQRKWSGKARP